MVPYFENIYPLWDSEPPVARKNLPISLLMNWMAATVQEEAKKVFADFVRRTYSFSDMEADRWDGDEAIRSMPAYDSRIEGMVNREVESLNRDLISNCERIKRIIGKTLGYLAEASVAATIEDETWMKRRDAIAYHNFRQTKRSF